MKYSPLGSGEQISQTFNDGCLETTFERENGLKSSYDVTWNILGDTRVSFQLPYRDWLKLEESEVWRNLDEYLFRVQTPDMHMFPQGPPFEAGKMENKSLVSRPAPSACGHLKQLIVALLRKDNKCH